MILLAIFILIQIADVWTTERGLAAGDEEAAPVGAGLFARLGFWKTVLLVKGIGIALAIVLALIPYGWIVFLILIAMGAAALYQNARVLTSTD